MQLRDKVILIISPQAWGTMYISKHHYAITLAKLGNRVYFLNPPHEGVHNKKGIVITHSGVHRNLFLVHHRLWFPFLIKFHAIKVFHWLMRFHINRVVKKIGSTIDIIWSFDQGHLYPFEFFDKKAFKIFQPVDEPGDKTALNAAIGADIILSVTREILEKYKSFTQPRHLINHGIGEDFFLTTGSLRNGKHIHIGVSGNLLRNDVDRAILLQIILDNPTIVFEFWGSYTMSQANLGGLENTETRYFIHLLKNQDNIILHGPVPQTEFAAALQGMDAFLICYDIQKDQSRGTNYHKIMEYLSTGKVVIASNISTYKDQPQLIQMVKERGNNTMLPGLFKKVIKDLGYYNSPALQAQRKAYAGKNTYFKQVDRIQDIIIDTLAS